MSNYIQELFNIEKPTESCISFEVNAKVFRDVFEHLQPLFKATVESPTFKLEVNGNIATITATPSYVFKQQFPVENVQGGDLNQNYIFSDICKLLPGRGTLKVIAASTVLKLTDDKTMSVTLRSSMADLLEVDLDAVDYQTFNLTQLQESIYATKRLAPIFKAYKKNPPMLFKGDVMQMLLPDLYIQSYGAKIDLVLDSTTANVLCGVFPDEVPQAQMALRGNEAYIKSYDSYFSCTCSRVMDVVDMDILLSAHTYITTLNYSTLYARLKSLQQAVGEGDVQFEIYTEHVEVYRLEGNNKVGCIVGNKKQDSDLLLSFTYKLELITPIVNFIGESIDIYKGGNVICWKKGKSMIMTSCRL